MSTELEVQLFLPQDAARILGCCPSTVKRVAEEIRLPILRSVGGTRFFTREQIDRIMAERQRREVEASRRSGR